MPSGHLVFHLTDWKGMELVSRSPINTGGNCVSCATSVECRRVCPEVQCVSNCVPQAQGLRDMFWKEGRNTDCDVEGDRYLMSWEQMLLLGDRSKQTSIHDNSVSYDGGVKSCHCTLHIVFHQFDIYVSLCSKDQNLARVPTTYPPILIWMMHICICQNQLQTELQCRSRKCYFFHMKSLKRQCSLISRSFNQRYTRVFGTEPLEAVVCSEVQCVSITNNTQGRGYWEGCSERNRRNPAGLYMCRKKEWMLWALGGIRGNHVLQKQLRVESRKYHKDIKLWEELRGFMYNLLCLSMHHFWLKGSGICMNLKQQAALINCVNFRLCFTDIKTDIRGKAAITPRFFFFFCNAPREWGGGGGGVIHGACTPSHISKPPGCPVVREEVFPQLGKTNSGILSNRVYCMCMRIFVFPFPPFFPIPINSWWNYCVIPWKLPNMSRCFTLELIARASGPGCSWLLALMWSDKACEARGKNRGSFYFPELL